MVFIWFAHTIKGGKALEPIKEFPPNVEIDPRVRAAAETGDNRATKGAQS